MFLQNISGIGVVMSLENNMKTPSHFIGFVVVKK